MKIIEEEKPQIVVNYLDSDIRNRFTMAHELGHLLMHHKWIPDSKLDGEENEIVEVTMYRHGTYDTVEESERETQANRFAASFLMPKDKVLNILKIAKDNLGDPLTFEKGVEIISNTFCTSNESAKYRLKGILIE